VSARENGRKIHEIDGETVHAWPRPSRAAAEGVSPAGKEVRMRRIGRAVLLEPMGEPFDLAAWWAKIDEHGRFPTRGASQAAANAGRRTKILRRRMICLDTDAVIVSINDPGSRVRSRFDRTVRDRVPVNVSSIVLFEPWFGVAKSRQRQYNADTLASFLAGPIAVMNFDADDAREAEIRAKLALAGSPIGPDDLLIAAQARRRGARRSSPRANASFPACRD
jgi:tRNA(fMet)-specific endonuclease VapC